jgi:transposase
MTSFLIVDAQSVKNTDSAEQKGYDAGKKVSGIKRHIGVDTQGLPHAIAITTAEVTDRSGALQAIDRCKPNLERVESVLVDGGYTGQPFADGVKERLEATVQVVKRNELHTICSAAQTLDRRMLLRLVGKVPKALEKLRTQTQYQLAVRSPRLPRTHTHTHTQKIVNRLLVPLTLGCVIKLTK